MSTKDQLADAFLQNGFDIDGLKLRPFTAGSYIIAERRGLSLFTGDSKGADNPEQLRQVMAFLYMQSAPLQEVLSASRNTEKWNDAVDLFALSVPVSAIPKAMELITILCEQAGAATVETIAKPGSSSSETPPPNC